MASRFRAKQEGLIPLSDPDFKSKITTVFVNYLNRCWMSLLRGDDSQVLDTFARIGHRSPVCVLNMMSMVGQGMIPNGDLIVTTWHESTEDTIRAYHDLALNYCRQKYAEAAEQTDLLEHECTGETLEELRATQPIQPLFQIGN